MENKTLKVSDQFILREIAGEYILIPIGTTALRLTGMINLTESGALLWERLQTECYEEDLVQLLLDNYDIDKKTAKADTHSFLDRLRELQVL